MSAEQPLAIAQGAARPERNGLRAPCLVLAAYAWHSACTPASVVARQHSRGFSLIEVMVTSVILGMGVIGVANLFTSSARGVGTSRMRETATQVALQRLERLATSPAAALPTCGGVVGCRATGEAMMPDLGTSPDLYECTQYVDDMGPSDPTARTTGGLAGYRLDTVVSPPPSLTQNDDARLISVSVCWTDTSGRIQQVLMQRLSLGDG